MNDNICSKHTPGPWIVRPLYATNGNRSAVFFEDRNKSGVHTRRLDDNGSFSHADAHLIAAAPDLLAALQSICDSGVALAEPIERQMLDALKLARGES